MTVMRSGYVRVKKRGEYRDWLEHRMVMDQMTKEFSYYGPGIPDGFEVHHIDYCKAHNCPENLLMLQAEIHDNIPNSNFFHERTRDENGKFITAGELRRYLDDAPDWVTA